MKIMTVIDIILKDNNLIEVIKNKNNLLGKGKEGEVYLYDQNNVVRVSRTKKNSIETYIYTKLTNKFILHSKNIKFKDGICYNIFDKADCDLDVFLFNMKNKLKEEERKKICKNICLGIKFLHDLDIIHGDIKPKNILYYTENKIKISDFGMSFKLGKDKKENKFFYTQRYKSEDKYVDKSSDIWALACTLFEVYYRKKYNPNNFYKENKIFDDLFLNMTKIESQERYLIDDILKHSFFN